MPLTLTNDNFNGLEMSLSNILKFGMSFQQWGFLFSKEVFLITTASNIFSIRSDTFSVNVKDLVKINLKIILADNYYLGLVKGNLILRNLEYNSDLTQNKNAFQSVASDLLGNGSVNTKFSNEPVPYSHRSIKKNRHL